MPQEAAPPSSPPPPPPGFAKLECSLHSLAFAYGQKVAPTNAASLHAALRLSQCAKRGLLTSGELAFQSAALSAAPPNRTALLLAGNTVYVATTGSDFAAGTLAAPLATVPGAVALIRKMLTGRGAVSVMIRGGKYYFLQTLALTGKDSNIAFDAYQQERVVFFGSKQLELKWRTSKGKIQVASAAELMQVLVSAEERKPSETVGDHEWASALAKLNQLLVDGVRQVRVRYPNGDPQDNSSICFSKDQYPSEENCNSYLSAAGQAGELPNGPGVGIVDKLDRGSAPAMPCPHAQCSTYGTFKYTISRTLKATRSTPSRCRASASRTSWRSPSGSCRSTGPAA